MAGVTAEITVDDREVRAVLRELARRGTHLREPLDDVGAYLEDRSRERFRDGREPGGAPWLRSLRAKLQGGKTLVDHGQLRDSITRATSDDRVEVGTNVPYAATHQFGAVIRPKSGGYLMFRMPDGSFRRVKQVTIPARPFLGVDGEDESEIVSILREWIDGAGDAAGVRS